MKKFTTIVIGMPKEETELAKVKEALNILKPYTTGMSLEDEMSILEMIEEHEDFDSFISEEARAKVKELHLNS